MASGEIDWAGVALAVQQIGKINAPSKIDELNAAAKIRKVERAENLKDRQQWQKDTWTEMDKRAAAKKVITDKEEVDDIADRKLAATTLRETLDKENVIKAAAKLEIKEEYDNKKIEEKNSQRQFETKIGNYRNLYTTTVNENEAALENLDAMGVAYGKLDYTSGSFDKLTKDNDLNAIENRDEILKAIGEETAYVMQEQIKINEYKKNVSFGKNLYSAGTYKNEDGERVSMDTDGVPGLSFEERKAGLAVVLGMHGTAKMNAEGLEEGYWLEHDENTSTISQNIQENKDDVEPTLSETTDLSSKKKEQSRVKDELFADEDNIDYINDMQKQYGDNIDSRWNDISAQEKASYNKARAELIKSDKLHYVETRGDYESEASFAEGADEGWTDFSGYDNAKTSTGITQDLYESITSGNLFTEPKSIKMENGAEVKLSAYQQNMDAKHAFHTVDDYHDSYVEGTLNMRQRAEYEEALAAITTIRKDTWGK